MNLKPAGKVVMILGIAIALYGLFEAASNSHLEKSWGNDASPNVGARAGERYRIDAENARKIDNQNDAIKILIAGGVVVVVGFFIAFHWPNKNDSSATDDDKRPPGTSTI